MSLTTTRFASEEENQLYIHTHIYIYINIYIYRWQYIVYIIHFVINYDQ